MNLKRLTLLTLSLASLALAERQLRYPGPPDESIPPPRYNVPNRVTLGYVPKWSDAGGVADVIEEGHSAEYGIDYLKLRVVSANYGCTNGQELIVHKEDMSNPEYPESLTYAYYPTNLSRIVFNVETNQYNFIIWPLFWNERDYRLNDDMAITNSTPYYRFFSTTRSWWYLDNQGGEPYAFWTNAVQFVRLEPNWTNYYELVRSGASSISNRVKENKPAVCIAERKAGFGGWVVTAKPLDGEADGSGCAGWVCEEGRWEAWSAGMKDSQKESFEKTAAEIARGGRLVHTPALLKFTTLEKPRKGDGGVEN